MSSLNNVTEDEWDRIQRQYYSGFASEQDELNASLIEDVVDQARRDRLNVKLEQERAKELDELTLKTNKLLKEHLAREQVGGDHYKDKAIEPIDYILANGLSFCEGNVVKYITRYKDKNGIEDLEKAKQYIEFLIDDERERF